jgi:hypothetical protein
VAELVSSSPGARSLVIKLPDNWSHPNFPARTSDRAFKKANSNRKSDLSAKRNIGLLLARLHGWNKIVFIDDDITLTRADNIMRLAAQLERHQVAGVPVKGGPAPDNSVVCHARRLAGFAQDVFVTGAILGVHCSSLPLSFFPDIYNEDWLFFAKEAAAGELPRAGAARQLWYDPFASTDRARREEFGDLLAEGLYALLGAADPSVPFDQQLRKATRMYWSYFMDARRKAITDAETALYGLMDRDADNGRVCSALNSLAASQGQLDTLTPDLCVNFLHAWRDDLADWQRFSNGVNNVGSTREAMDFLELKNWIWAEFGAPVVESGIEADQLTTPVGVRSPSSSVVRTA